ncbi:MAG: galactokinase [Armatimonadota bacterium]|nr:galactokinase [Armatimonadota bacterium]
MSPAELFRERFGRPPSFLVTAPGRVNLIGEHTDYNAGLVLPAAIERALVVAADAGGGPRIRLYAAAFDAVAEFSADAPGEASLPRWARYAQGVAVYLVLRGIVLRGLDAVVAGDLPIGSGLSSSAAFEVAVALTLERIAGVTLPPRERALLCHRVEGEFVGVPCGIMDQFAVSLCRRDHALFLDCRSLETHHIPLPAGVVLAVCDTGVRRALQASPYGERRQECQEAVRLLQQRRPMVTSLRDLMPDDLPLLDPLPPRLRRRARHVVAENARVIEAARALEGGETGRLREIFLASHQSLRDDFEVSCPELDAMVEAALEAPGCLAARMTGAGFGGAVVALVEREEQSRFLEVVEDGYRRRTGRRGLCFTSAAAGGARAEAI